MDELLRVEELRRQFQGVPSTDELSTSESYPNTCRDKQGDVFLIMSDEVFLQNQVYAINEKINPFLLLITSSPRHTFDRSGHQS